MNVKHFFIIALTTLVAICAVADDVVSESNTANQDEVPLEEKEEREFFEKWHIGVGLELNSHIRSDIKMRNLPVPRAYRASSAYSSKADAYARALARRYDGGGFIDSDSLDNGFDTENWKLPANSYYGDGHFVPNNAYREVYGSKDGHSNCDHSDKQWQFGIFLELSRELWIHGEEDEEKDEENAHPVTEMTDEEEKEEEGKKHRYGVDFAAALSYFFAEDIFDACASTSRSTPYRDGVIRTDVIDPDTTYDYDHGQEQAPYLMDSDGMYGYGNLERTFINPALGFAGISDPYNVSGRSGKKVSSLRYHGDGDYRELELLLMLRPWYEIKDWWRIYAEGGLAVSWGRFETTVRGSGLSHNENFEQWDLYGVVGVGTVFRYDDFTIGIDGIYRFLRDDFDVDGRYLDGEIHRAKWGCRIMIGYEF